MLVIELIKVSQDIFFIYHNISFFDSFEQKVLCYHQAEEQ